jgi:hypothetical protein
MFEMLAEVISAEELLRLITFAEFVLVSEMGSTRVPIGLWVVWKLFATVATCVQSGDLVWSRGRWLLCRTVIGRRNGGRRIECIVVTAVESSA